MLISSRQPIQRPAQNSGLKNTNASSTRFAGINANHSENVNNDMYIKSQKEHPEEHEFGKSATSLLREFDMYQAIGHILKDKVPTKVISAGCSDGSDLISTALFAHQQLTNAHIKDPKRIQLTGIDIDKDIINVANTGFIPISDVEIARNNVPSNPIQGGKFPIHFELKKQTPEAIEALVKDSPRLAQLTRDPVAGVKIGERMHWYKVKPQKLPKMNFEHVSIEDYVKRTPSAHQRQLYLMANSWGYMMASDTSTPASMPVDPEDKEKISHFLSVIEDLKKHNQGKEVLIVIGSIESALFNGIPAIKNALPGLGMKPLSVAELQSAGVPNIGKVHGKIWRLDCSKK